VGLNIDIQLKRKKQKTQTKIFFCPTGKKENGYERKESSDPLADNGII